MSDLILVLLMFFIFPTQGIAEVTESKSSGKILESWASVHPKLRQKELCDDLKVGESRSVHWDEKASPTEVATSFTLKRKSKKKWEVHLNLGFENSLGRGYDKKKLDQVYRKRARDCFAKSPQFKTKTGHQVEFILPKSSVTKKQIHKHRHKIGIKGYSFRSNSNAWAANLSCPGIIHESMHILGLSDEYQESSTKVPSTTWFFGMLTDKNNSHLLAYDCRSIGEKTSMMNNHESAYAEASKGIYQADYMWCGPLAGGQNLKLRLSLHRKDFIDKALCPAGFGTLIRQGSGRIHDVSGESLEELYESEIDRNIIKNNVYATKTLGPRIKEKHPVMLITNLEVIKKPSGVVEIKPAQFQHIRYTGCQSKNSQYYDCARNAYRSSQETGCVKTRGDCKSPGAIHKVK